MKWSWLSGMCVAATWLGLGNACVGDDPAPDVAPSAEAGGASSSGGATSSSSSGAAQDDGGTDTAAGDRGVFLTSLTYETSFLAGKTYEERVAHADGLCKDAARDAGVLRADAYRALLAVGANDQEHLNDATRFQAQASGEGRWCAIRPSAAGLGPHCAGADLVFRSALHFIAGPAAPLLTDERGTTVLSGATGIDFFSGLLLDTSQTAHVVNCTGWSSSNDADSGIVVADPLPENLFGYGNTAQVAAGSAPYEWITQRDFCLRQQLRLMCVERPL